MKSFWKWMSSGPASVVDGLVHTLTLGCCSTSLSSSCYYRALDYVEAVETYPYTVIHDEGPEPEEWP